LIFIHNPLYSRGKHSKTHFEIHLEIHSKMLSSAVRKINPAQPVSVQLFTKKEKYSR
jgi:hypothetical protein